jgi:hypothetical protein
MLETPMQILFGKFAEHWRIENVFDNKQLQENLKNEFDIDRAFNISDQALAKNF